MKPILTRMSLLQALLLLGTVCYACTKLEPTNQCVAEGFQGSGIDENGISYDIIATEDCMVSNARPAMVGEEGESVVNPHNAECCAEAKKLLYDENGEVVAQIDTEACNNCDTFFPGSPPTPCPGTAVDLT